MSIATFSIHRRGAGLVAAGLLALSLTGLAACGGSDEATTVSGEGFQVSAPDGWTRGDDATRRALGISPDVVLHGDRFEGVRVSINVWREPLPPGQTIEDYLETARRQNSDAESLEYLGLDASDAADIPEATPATLGGEKALVVDYERALKGKRVRQQQVYAARRGVAYVVTYSASPARFGDDQDDFDAILDSWRWS